MTQKRRLRDLVKQSAPTLAVVIIGILFYIICINFPQIQAGIGKFLKAIGPIILGMVFAFIVNIPMSFFERHLFKRIKKPSTRRIISLLCAVLLFILLLTALIALIIPRVIETITDITNNIIKNYSDYLNKIYGFIDNIAESLNLDISAEEEMNVFITDFFNDYKDLINNLVPFLTQAAGNIINFILNSVLMIVFGIYMLASKEKYVQIIKTFFLAILPKRASTFFFDANSTAYGIIRRYVLGTLVDCCSLGIMTFIGLMILKIFIPMDLGLAGLLSVLVGVTQLLPVIGPWIGSAVGGLLLVWYNPVQALWFIIIVILVQQIDNNIVLPRIVGKMVGISGLLVISAVLVGSKLFGIVGALVCVPITAVLFAIATDVISRRIEMLNLTDKQRAEMLERNGRNADRIAIEMTKEAACFIEQSAAGKTFKSSTASDKKNNAFNIVCTKTKEFVCKIQKKPIDSNAQKGNVNTKTMAKIISATEANKLKNEGHVFLLKSDGNIFSENNNSNFKTIKLKARVKTNTEQPTDSESTNK